MTQRFAASIDSEPAAARLALHRNTVRNRIDRIARLTCRRLDDGDDGMELRPMGCGPG